MKEVAILICVAAAWGFLMGYLTGRADGRDQGRHAKPRKAHKVMTAAEYPVVPIRGWHEVCRDVDGFGGVGIRYITNGE